MWVYYSTRVGSALVAVYVLVTVGVPLVVGTKGARDFVARSQGC